MVRSQRHRNEEALLARVGALSSDNISGAAAVLGRVISHPLNFMSGSLSLLIYLQPLWDETFVIDSRVRREYFLQHAILAPRG